MYEPQGVFEFCWLSNSGKAHRVPFTVTPDGYSFRHKTFGRVNDLLRAVREYAASKARPPPQAPPQQSSQFGRRPQQPIAPYQPNVYVPPSMPSLGLGLGLGGVPGAAPGKQFVQPSFSQPSSQPSQPPLGTWGRQNSTPALPIASAAPITPNRPTVHPDRLRMVPSYSSSSSSSSASGGRAPEFKADHHAQPERLSRFDPAYSARSSGGSGSGSSSSSSSSAYDSRANGRFSSPPPSSGIRLLSPTPGSASSSAPAPWQAQPSGYAPLPSHLQMPSSQQTSYYSQPSSQGSYSSQQSQQSQQQRTPVARVSAPLDQDAVDMDIDSTGSKEQRSNKKAARKEERKAAREAARPPPTQPQSRASRPTSGESFANMPRAEPGTFRPGEKAKIYSFGRWEDAIVEHVAGANYGVLIVGAK